MPARTITRRPARRSSSSARARPVGGRRRRSGCAVRPRNPPGRRLRIGARSRAIEEMRVALQTTGGALARSAEHGSIVRWGELAHGGSVHPCQLAQSSTPWLSQTAELGRPRLDPACKVPRTGPARPVTASRSTWADDASSSVEGHSRRLEAPWPTSAQLHAGRSCEENNALAVA
jgi:hypothetical protein